ncbi:MAG: hypothetical protein M1449_00245 [Candidatus Thermoplasmatota archaeon]|nr:hypothetical protein [Candidatus Thermoplasmatota archaeon]
MSLLLKALKQAEAAHVDKSVAGNRDEGDLELEPLGAQGVAQAREWVEPPPLLFGSSGLSPEPNRAPAFRWPRLSLVPLTALLAALIALGYGIYLYFALQPPAAVPPAIVAAPVAAEPAPAALPAPAFAQVEPAAEAPAEVAPQPPARSEPPARSVAPAPTALPLFRPDTQTTVLAQAYAAYQRGALTEAQRLYTQAAARTRSVDALLG